MGAVKNSLYFRTGKTQLVSDPTLAQMTSKNFEF